MSLIHFILHFGFQRGASYHHHSFMPLRLLGRLGAQGILITLPQTWNYG